MADQKLTELASATAANNADLMYIVQSNASKKIAVSSLVSSIAVLVNSSYATIAYVSNVLIPYATKASVTAALTSYTTNANLTSTLSLYATDIELAAAITTSNAALTATLLSYTTNANLTATLASYTTNANLTSTLASFTVSKLQYSSLTVQLNSSGSVTFPTNISIDYSGGNAQFPRIIADSGKAFSIQGQGSTGSAALAWTVDPNAASQYASVGVTKGGGDNLAKVILQAQSNSGDAGTAKTWIFDENANATFPVGVTLLHILKIDDGVHEKFQAKTSSTGTVTHDCSLGHVFYHTSSVANWTANFTNLSLSSSYATTVTLVIPQGGTGYYPSAVQIGGAAQTILWQGNTTPTPSTNRTDVVTFSILNNSGTYIVLGQLTGF